MLGVEEGNWFEGFFLGKKEFLVIFVGVEANDLEKSCQTSFTQSKLH